MKLFGWLFKGSENHYEIEKKHLMSADVAKRRKLAADETMRPEILYYLADDPDRQVRRSVAQNASTPLQIGDALAKDRDGDVRLFLARRLVELLPDLNEELHGQLYAFAVQALGILAQDEILDVRRALTTALKDRTDAPLSIMGQLARDVEREISEPILKFCARISDDDLLDILGHHPEPWVMSAIASRTELSTEVSDNIAKRNSKLAGFTLLGNNEIELSDEALYTIIDQAKEYTNWHEPLIQRKELSQDMVQSIVGFVSDKILDILQDKTEFKSVTCHEITDLVKRRMVFKYAEQPHETVEQKVNRYIASDEMNVFILQDALAWGETGFVKIALSKQTGVHILIIEKIFATQSPKATVALAWHAEMSARFAVEMQQSIGHIQPKDTLYAKEGAEYPLSEAEMIWQLEFFGIELQETIKPVQAELKKQ